MMLQHVLLQFCFHFVLSSWYRLPEIDFSAQFCLKKPLQFILTLDSGCVYSYFPVLTFFLSYFLLISWNDL